ncbi:MAG: NADH-quinone oxidoreductase subunit H [Acidimicrobiales bacterium]|nr:MAG: NADH-quinone oxidoreductase subunit H [Acidimicrobiales bacterium]
MGDPLLRDVDLVDVLIVSLKVVLAFGMLLVAVMFMVWFERKFIGDLQNRIGPNRAGPWGILQTLADGVKLFFKEDSIPAQARRRIFVMAPVIATVPAFLTFTVIPLGGDFTSGGTVRIFGRETFLQVADPPVGVLLVLALSSVAVYGVMLAGWSSGSKYPLLGSVRASAQMVSYEAALALSVASVVLVSGSLSTHEIVRQQAGSGLFGFLPDWNLLATGLIPFLVFVVAGTAELNRPPFDLVEAEQELVGGFHTEYSSIRFALFFLAEFMNTVTMSALIVTLFLGGPAGPAPFGPPLLWSIFWFALKTAVFLVMFVSFRATLPRFRYDQLMDLGWKVLIPLSLGWFVALSLIRMATERDWNLFVTAVGVVSILSAGGTLLWLADRAGRRARAQEVTW